MSKAKGKTANIFVWIILGLLIIGLAGFGVEGFGGRVNKIGSVGDREIGVQDYFRSLQREIRRIEQQSGQALGFEGARAMGLDRMVLAQLVTVAALENEADRLGISVGDGTVRDEVLAIPEFRGLDGQFNREAYRFALQQEGWSEREFEDRLRRELARSILQAGAVAGAAAPPTFVDVVDGWVAERRSFALLTLTRSALTEPVPSPSDSALRAHYEANPEEFTLPEARRISYAWVTPAMLADAVEIEEEALREAYRLRADEFARPERRLVERIVFADAAAAEAARDRLDAGEEFSAIAAERGLDPEDIDMGDVTEAQLGEAGAEVFALERPGVAGPLPTAFGPALFNVVAVLAAQEVPFEEALPELREQLAMDRARRMISDSFDDFEDILAGGAELEELARDTVLEFGTIDLRPGDDGGIARYEDFRTAAAQVSERDFPEMRALADGGVFALRLDEIVPPELRPFDEVVVEVIDSWDRVEAAERLAARAQELRAALEAGEEPEGPGIDLARYEEVLRTDRLPGLPRAVLEAAFGMSQGATQVIESPEEERAFVLLLEDVLPADADAPEAAARRTAIAREARAGIADDLFVAWAQLLEREAGISLDQSAIEAVHDQMR